MQIGDIERGITKDGWSLEEVNHDRPDREHDQEHDPERVGYPVRPREGVPEPARRADVLLQQVAPDEKAY